MKYIAIYAFLLLVGIAGNGQMKSDTIKNPIFAIEGYMSCGKIVPERAITIDVTQFLGFIELNTELWDRVKLLERRIDSLEHRPYLYIDTKTSRPGIWLTNTAGEYQVFIVPLIFK